MSERESANLAILVVAEELEGLAVDLRSRTRVTGRASYTASTIEEFARRLRARARPVHEKK